VWYEPLGNEDVLFFYSPAMQLRWDRMNLHERMLWITGQLWNCSDILPGLICSELELPQGSTYSRAVRKLRTEAAAEGGGTGDGRARRGAASDGISTLDPALGATRAPGQYPPQYRPRPSAQLLNSQENLV
jgi:hypothetical protein